jgi:hypothetical protein
MVTVPTFTPLVSLRTCEEEFARHRQLFWQSKATATGLKLSMIELYGSRNEDCVAKQFGDGQSDSITTLM